MWPLRLNTNSQTALSEAPVVDNLTADQLHLECSQKSESVHTCIPPASNLQVTDIPQHHHLNKWVGKYFFIFTQEPGNSPWLLDLWTESLPLHKSLVPLGLHAVKTLYLILLVTFICETDNWRQHSWARCCPCRSLQREKKNKRKESGEFTVQVLPFYCGFSLGLTNPPLPCQLQTGWLTAASKHASHTICVCSV